MDVASSPPFSRNTQIWQIFTILSDLEWHCGKHELPGTQPAKPIQIIRQNGYEVENKRMHCDTCGYATVHRRLVSVEPTNLSVVRSGIPSSVSARVKALYGNRDSLTQREWPAAQLEVDHRFPQVRWAADENANSPTMSDSELRHRFQLLTRQNNLWKSRYCERCASEGVRGTFIGIEYFYAGGPHWPAGVDPHDEQGCVGCVWYDPDEWRRGLNALIGRARRQSTTR